MRKVLSGLAVVALACATGSAAFAQDNGTSTGANGGTNPPSASQTDSRYPTSSPMHKDADDTMKGSTKSTNGSMGSGTSGAAGATNGDVNTNGGGSVNGSVNGAGTTGAPVPAAPGSVNANGQPMVDVHDPTWQYEMMAKQYHWSAPPPRTGGSTTRNPQ